VIDASEAFATEGAQLPDIHDDKRAVVDMPEFVRTVNTLNTRWCKRVVEKLVQVV
jgi:hypothetical protein